MKTNGIVTPSELPGNRIGDIDEEILDKPLFTIVA